jgi:hypothetical protein
VAPFSPTYRNGLLVVAITDFSGAPVHPPSPVSDHVRSSNTTVVNTVALQITIPRGNSSSVIRYYTLFFTGTATITVSAPGLGTFQSCRDELDSLAVFTYRDPRVLLELVRRRFVTDISCYFRKYSGSRMEPPSLILAAEDLGNYVHLPVGNITQHLSSLLPSESDEEEKNGEFTTFGVGSGLNSGDSPYAKRRKENQSSIPDLLLLPVVEPQAEIKTSKENFHISRMKTIPQIHQKLDTEAFSRLKHLPSPYTRSFELLYQEGRISLLIGSTDDRDLEAYKGLLVSIYGEFEFVKESAIPSCMRIVLELEQNS